MTADDPFRELGLERDADADSVRAARRRLARDHHPDQGGDAARMQQINEAADAALVAIAAAARPAVDVDVADPSPAGRSPHGAPGHRDAARREAGPGVLRDVPSFTVEALPAETFEALSIVTTWMGEVLDDDPPYRLDTYLSEPFDCWCRLDVVPDAGASTISITIAGLDDTPPPDLLAVRDAWVGNLNALDWG